MAIWLLSHRNRNFSRLLRTLRLCHSNSINCPIQDLSFTINCPGSTFPILVQNPRKISFCVPRATRKNSPIVCGIASGKTKCRQNRCCVNLEYTPHRCHRHQHRRHIHLHPCKFLYLFLFLFMLYS